MARALAASVYLPTLISEVGVGAVYPLLALTPLGFGASAAAASAAVAAYLAGRIPGSAWGGFLAGRIGAARASAWALGLMAAASLVCAASTSLAPFYLGAALLGLAHAALHVSRQAQVLDMVPRAAQARGLTTLAGIWRIGNFAGPLLGAVVLQQAGQRWAYVLAAVCVAGGMAALTASPAWRDRRQAVLPARVPLLKVARAHRRVLATLGLAVAFTGAVRAARLVAIPVWAHAIGLSDARTSAIFALSAAVDMLLFWPAGSVMDRWGRRWTAIPSTLTLALGVALMPLTATEAAFTVFALALGVGNGWGSGLLMTLGGDVAPRRGRESFIGLWMILQDLGGLAGPLVMSAGSLIALSGGFYAVGALGAATTVMLHRWIPPHRRADPAEEVS